MKEAVIARNAFVAGHSGYAIALKNTCAALSDYGHGETEETLQIHPEQHSPSQPPPPPPPIDNLPPPPLPNFTPSPIKRAATMPSITMESNKSRREIESHTIAEEYDAEENEDHEVGKDENGKGLHGSRNGVGEMGHGVASSSIYSPRTSEVKAVQPPLLASKGMAWDYFFMIDENMSFLGGEDDNDGEHDENVHMGFGKDGNLGCGFGDGINGVVEPKTPEIIKEGKVGEGEEGELMKVKPIEHSNSAPPEFRRVGKVMGVSTVNLMQTLTKLDDHFMKASESAQEVSIMLEATRLHYHSNFAGNRGHIDHFARVMRVITWNRSFKGMHNGGGGRDEFDSEEYEFHATLFWISY